MRTPAVRLHIHDVHEHSSCVDLMSRIHILVDDEDKARYRRQAEREGLSLGAWLRQAAEEKLAVARKRVRFETVEELRSFFEECDARESEPEPDWMRHVEVVERSRSEGVDCT